MHFQDCGVHDNVATVSYVTIKDDSWTPVLCEISRKSVQIHCYKDYKRTVGLTYARNTTMASNGGKQIFTLFH